MPSSIGYSSSSSPRGVSLFITFRCCPPSFWFDDELRKKMNRPIDGNAETTKEIHIIFSRKISSSSSNNIVKWVLKCFCFFLFGNHRWSNRSSLAGVNDDFSSFDYVYIHHTDCINTRTANGKKEVDRVLYKIAYNQTVPATSTRKTECDTEFIESVSLLFYTSVAAMPQLDFVLSRFMEPLWLEMHCCICHQRHPRKRTENSDPLTYLCGSSRVWL